MRVEKNNQQPLNCKPPFMGKGSYKYKATKQKSEAQKRKPLALPAIIETYCTATNYL
jgi:hypothetical protein